MSNAVTDGATPPWMASGPGFTVGLMLPPRMSAPGSPVVAAPIRHCKSPVGLTPAVHVPQPDVVDRGTQSATHSQTFPTMSNAPRADVQLLREPLFTVVPTLVQLQSVVPLSAPGSGVPITAACHSAFEGSRLRAFSHAACAWNHVTFADGRTPGRLAAKTSPVQFCPLSPHGA